MAGSLTEEECGKRDRGGALARDDGEGMGVGGWGGEGGASLKRKG